MIRAVIFDFNGILADDDPIHMEALLRVVREEGLNFTPEEYLERYLPLNDWDCFRELWKTNEEIMSKRSRRTFQQLVTLPDGAIPLAEAALLLACEEYPQLEISPYLDQLDEIAGTVRSRMHEGDSPLTTIDSINTVLFDVMGFRGNTEDYNDPRNSFFNDVLERKLGIPITLSTVYLEVARRLSFPISGVGLPGHFIVKYVDRNQELLLDPFNRGEILTRDDCARRLSDLFGGTQTFSEEMLSSVTPRQILLRMLNNLKAIYLRAQTYDKGLSMVELMLLIEPSDFGQFRDRGVLKVQLRRFADAARDFEYYIKNVPGAKDRPQVLEHLKELRRIQAMMN